MAASQSLLLIGGIALAALVLVLWQAWQIRRLRLELDEIRRQLEQPRPEKTAPTRFSTNLERAEKEQLQSSPPNIPRNPTEKYRYISSLAEQGMAAEGIAAALQMPRAEVEQLLQLAKLKQR